MASVMVLQVLHDYSDAEAAEAARCDLRWKAACGFPLDHEGFDPSTLVFWGRRIAGSARPDRISDAVRKIVAETGVLKGRPAPGGGLDDSGRCGGYPEHP